MISRSLIKYLLLVFGMMTAFVSCKDDKQTIYPEVRFLHPANNAQYDVLDTVMMRIVVNYPKPFVSLRIGLQDEAFTPVMSSQLITDFSTGAETVLYYPISMSNLASGNYNLMAEARDSEVYTRAYRQLFIHEIERELRYVFVVGQTGNSEPLVNRFDANMQNPSAFHFDGDYVGSAVSSASQQFFIAGKHRGDITAIDAEGLSQNWVVPIIPNPVIPYLTCLQSFDGHLFAGFWQGQIGRWKMQGVQGVSTEMTEYTAAYLLFAGGKYLVAASQQKGNINQQWLEVFYLDGGGLLTAVETSVRPVIFSKPESGKILIIGNNSNGTASTQLFNPADGMLSQPYQPFDLPAVSVIAGAATNPVRILLVTDEGVWMYHYQTSLTQLIQQPGIKAIRYNDIHRNIWCLTHDSVLVFNLSGSLFAQYAAGNNLIDLHLIYNK